MNKSDIKFCPWEPCSVELKAEDVISISDMDIGGDGHPTLEIRCTFCKGRFIIIDLQAEDMLSKEDVGKKWDGIPLTDPRAVKLAKRKERRKKK